MSEVSPLRAGDPAELGGHRLIGRLGAGGQGVVYLGESERGDRVAVKVLHASADEDANLRFRREAELLPRIASFCTAQVLAVGTAGPMPYIVSEFVEGPTLQQAVRQRGPLRGRELRQVAVGTVTALAAIHRAGVVHRDFKPANVLLGRDGPRVIDFGIARTMDAGVTGGGVLGTPAYMAPEQVSEAPLGPATDMFAWAATVVFAGSGRPPFGNDSIPAIMHRVLYEEPDLGPLDGDLRAIVADCLAKDPTRRPGASQVLLRLLGQPAPLKEQPISDRDLREGKKIAGTPVIVPGSGRRHLVQMLTGLLAAGMVAAVPVTYLLTRADPPSPPAPTEPSPTYRLSGAPPPATARIPVPELKATLFEHPTDPIRVTSFTVTHHVLNSPAYVRMPGAAEFHKLPERLNPIVSPDGTTIATVYQLPNFVSDAARANTVSFTDRVTGATFSVPTVDKPLLIKTPEWSRDGRRLLASVYTYDSKKSKVRPTIGFVVIDIAARTSKFTRVEDPGVTTSSYGWAPDGEGVIRRPGAAKDGVLFFALDGTPGRTIEGLRWTDDTDATFSPSGRLLAALCPEKVTAVCVVDATTGERKTRFTLAKDTYLWDWFNEDHLLVFDKRRSPWRAEIVDFSNRAVRLFAEFTGNDDTYWQLNFSPR
jgi:serine/threonine protein kinase